MTIYHKHHIVPKHMGGSDDPSNLVELTIEEHAEAHRKLYEEHGKIEDKIAWLGLSGLIKSSDAALFAMRLGQSNTINNHEFTKDERIKGGKNRQLQDKELPSKGGKALWSKPGMREHLSKKRKEQSAMGKNPMQGRKQKRVCCIVCRKETAINTLKSNHKKMF